MGSGRSRTDSTGSIESTGTAGPSTTSNEVNMDTRENRTASNNYERDERRNGMQERNKNAD